MNQVLVEEFADASEVAESAARALLSKLSTLLEVKSEAHVALTGGTVGILTLAKLAHMDSNAVDWSRVHIWWGDERFVSPDSPDRNARQAREAWLNQSAVPEQNIHEYPSTADGDLVSAAAKFDELLEAFWGQSLAEFDVVLLGVGPDGHVASLFPGHPQLIPHQFTVIESNSPKPPASRLSFSYEMLNNATEVWFTVAGADKADAYAAAMSNLSSLPVARIHAKLNRWFVDAAAAAKL